MTTEPNLETFLIPLEEIKSGTDNFSEANCIGRGGFGKVYKGKLTEFRSIDVVAIKRLDPKLGQGKIEFDKEVEVLYLYKHENIITFIGYCNEGGELIIVYEYAANGSLDKHLRDTNKMRSMPWLQRLEICVGAAKGLNYLHYDLGPHHRIIHRDVKSSNILLDGNWEAKVSDFGLSKLGPKDEPYTKLDTRVAGTIGYCDPYYRGTSILSKESDVFSLGVVLFELLCGRLVYPKNNSICTDDDNSRSLVELVYRYRDSLDKIIDPHIRDRIDPKSLWTFKEIAMQCLEFDFSKRPTMTVVLEKLEEALDFQLLVGVGAALKTTWGSGSKGNKLAIHLHKRLYIPKEKKKKKEKKESRGGTEEEFPIDVHEINEFEMGAGPKSFSYKKLSLSTGNFAEENKIGEGRFGAVYRGFLKDLDTYVAVKRLSKSSRQGIKEYGSQVRILSRLRHRNLVQLIGWCLEKNYLLLVYEFMENGSLDLHLFKFNSLLAWEVRYKIAKQLASALLYLHEELEQCVLHRNIKPSNIMLDSDSNAKLGDFGLPKLVDPVGGFQTTISLAGTRGYMAPEYYLTLKSSKETDVYSFGVVALEIACGRRCIDMEAPERQIRLEEWVWELYGMGNLLEAADPRLDEGFDELEIEQLMIVGLWCAHPDSDHRPSISQVIQVLNFKDSLPRLPSKMPVATFSSIFGGKGNKEVATPSSCGYNTESSD